MRKLSPNYADGYFNYALVIEDPLRIREKIGLVEKAMGLDPRQPHYRSILGQEYFRLGNYADGERELLKFLESNPDFAIGYHELGDNYFWYMGDLVKGLEAFNKAVEIDPGDFSSRFHQFEIYLELGLFESARNIRQQMAAVAPDNPRLVRADLDLVIYAGDDGGFVEAAERWQRELQDATSQYRMVLLAYDWLRFGDLDRARELLLLSTADWIQPDRWDSLVKIYDGDSCIAAWILMQTGDAELGEQLLERATYFLTEELPAAVNHADVRSPDTCFLAAGETERALESIETQLEHNHLYDWDMIHSLPMYDAIREHPRYVAAKAEP